VSSTLTVVALLAIGALVAAAYVLLLHRSGVGRPTRSSGGTSRPEPSAPRPLSLRAVIDRLAVVGDEQTVLLDRRTGRFVMLDNQLLAAVESDDPVEDLIDDTVAFTEPQLEELRRKLRAKKLLPLPTKTETKEFQLRERFCAELPEGDAKEEMQKVVRGQTGFRSFDGAVTRLRITEKWNQFRDTGFAAVAVAWLQRHEIPFVCDVTVPEHAAEFRQAGERQTRRPAW